MWLILFKSENEYTDFEAPYTEDFEYEKLLQQQLVWVEYLFLPLVLIPVLLD